jgi:hypothetical protein
MELLVGLAVIAVAALLVLSWRITHRSAASLLASLGRVESHRAVWKDRHDH